MSTMYTKTETKTETETEVALIFRHNVLSNHFSSKYLDL